MREVRSEGERKVIVTRCVPHEILEVRDTDGEESQMEKQRGWGRNANEGKNANEGRNANGGKNANQEETWMKGTASRRK